MTTTPAEALQTIIADYEAVISLIKQGTFPEISIGAFLRLDEAKKLITDPPSLPPSGKENTEIEQLESLCEDRGTEISRLEKVMADEGALLKVWFEQRTELLTAAKEALRVCWDEANGQHADAPYYAWEKVRSSIERAETNLPVFGAIDAITFHDTDLRIIDGALCISASVARDDIKTLEKAGRMGEIKDMQREERTMRYLADKIGKFRADNSEARAAARNLGSAVPARKGGAA